MPGAESLQTTRPPDLARGLAARLRDASDAADRLAAFSDSGVWEGPAACTLCAGDELATAEDFVLRALAATGDAVNFRVLAAAGAAPDGVALTALAASIGLTRLALIERVHGLIQLGLVARDLPADTVCATSAGTGMLALVEDLQREVATWLEKRRRR